VPHLPRSLQASRDCVERRTRALQDARRGLRGSRATSEDIRLFTKELALTAVDAIHQDGWIPVLGVACGVASVFTGAAVVLHSPALGIHRAEFELRRKKLIHAREQLEKLESDHNSQGRPA
jgi:hypothetical protein